MAEYQYEPTVVLETNKRLFLDDWGRVQTEYITMHSPKLCPFCGKGANFLEEKLSGDTLRITIGCANSNCAVHPMIIRYVPYKDRDKERQKIISDWNTRCNKQYNEISRLK